MFHNSAAVKDFLCWPGLPLCVPLTFTWLVVLLLITLNKLWSWDFMASIFKIVELFDFCFFAYPSWRQNRFLVLLLRWMFHNSAAVKVFFCWPVLMVLVPLTFTWLVVLLLITLNKLLSWDFMTSFLKLLWFLLFSFLLIQVGGKKGFWFFSGVECSIILQRWRFFSAGQDCRFVYHLLLLLCLCSGLLLLISCLVVCSWLLF